MEKPLSLDDWGSYPGNHKRLLSSPKRPNWLWETTQPLIQWVPGFFPGGVKQTGHEVGLSPPSGAEVKDKSSNTSMLPTCLHGMQRVTLLLTLHYM